MLWLVDTNILLRLIEPGHAMHADALAASSALLGAGETVNTLPQNIAEFWNVCTRPLDKTGLGLSPAQTDAEVTNAHGVTRLLTFNDQDFKRYQGITVLTPAEVIKSYPPQPTS